MKGKKIVALLLTLGISLTSLAQLTVGAFAQSDVSEKEDFFEAVNGEWLETTKLSDGQIYMSQFTIMGVNNTKRLIDLLDAKRLDKNAKTSPNEKLVIDLYNQVLDVSSRTNEGIKPIEPLLDKIRNVSDQNELIEVADELSSIGIKSFLSYEIGADFKDSSKNILYLNTVQLEVVKNYLVGKDEMSQSIQQMYGDYLKKLFMASGYSESESMKKSKSVLEFSKVLAPYTVNNQDLFNFDKVYNVYTLDEIKKDYPALKIDRSLEKLDLAKAEKIVVFSPEYLEFLNNAISKSPLVMLKNYLEASLLSQSAPLLSPELDKTKVMFINSTMGIDSIKPEKERALAFVDKNLSWPVGEIFVKNFFPEEAIKEIESLVSEIKDAYRVRLEKNLWLDANTKKNAIDKLDALSVKIGYPETWKDYSSIQIKSYDKGGSLFESFKNIERFKIKEMADNLNTKVDKNEWNSPPHVVNAMYSPNTNEMTFLAGILQEPFYTFGASKEQNLGALGSVVGHEITHAFDVTGSQFDKNGNMANWWSKEDTEKYKKISQAMIEKFNQVEVKPGVFVDGNLTLGENTADIGGISVALDVMAKLDNPDYDKFFKSYASHWKSIMTAEFQDMLLKVDPHSPHKVRVNEILKHIDKFHEEYNTSEGDKMYLAPKDRMKIW